MMGCEVTEVLEKVTECGEVMMREQVDQVVKVARLLVRGELRNGEE